MTGVCAGAIHEAMKRSEAVWQSLKLIGFGCGLEWRNCACGSTLAREIREEVQRAA